MATRSPERQNALRRRWLVVAGALFILAMLASTAHGLWTSRQQAEQRAGRELSVLARVLAEQTRRSLQAADVMLAGIASDARAGELLLRTGPQLHDYLGRRRTLVADAQAVFVLDAAGHPRAGSDPVPTTFDRGAGLAAFQRLKEGAANAVAPVVRGGPGGPWLLPILRRSVDAQGNFTGAVGALLDAGYFERFYAGVQLGVLNVIALHGADGTLLVRHPPRDEVIGRVLPNWQWQLAPPGTVPQPHRLFSSLDGVERFGLAQPVPDYGLHVVVTRDTDKLFAPWRAEARGSIMRTVLLCTAAIALLAVVLRQLQRLEAARASLARSEAALRVSEERYALAVAGSNEGLWDWDLPGDQVFFSERAQEVCGLLPGEPLRPRESWLGALRYHPHDRDAIRAALVSHLRGRSAHFDVEMRLARPGSGARPEQPEDWNWVRQRGLVVRDEHGRLRRMAGSIEDITGRKRAEAQREQLEVRLRTAQKLEAMGTLAGGIAHDFNNILGAILGYAELAHGRAAAGTPLQEQLEGVMNAGLRAKSLVQRILAFSRSGLGEQVPVHVQSLVEEALDLLQATVPPGIRLQRELHAAHAALVGDPAQIHQVVMNLGTNAVQASHAPAVISFRLMPRTLPAASLFTSGVLPPGRYLELVVRDEGCGMAPPQVERIFDPFFTTKEVGVGTGLGLSLVHGIVAELQGGIDVRSAPGQGSVFTVLLPWSGALAPEPGTGLPDAALPHGDGERILVVDDEPALVALAEETLARLGYEPVGYTSSVAALAALESAPALFDAVLTDDAMPQLTGTELAAAVHRLRPDLPVLLMTGYVSVALAARAQAAGVCQVLGKPVVARDIASAVADALATSVRARGALRL